MEQQHQALVDLVKFPLLTAEIKAHFKTFLEGILEGGVSGGELSISSAAMPTAVACHRNRPVVPMSGSFNASSSRLLMERFVLDMLSGSCCADPEAIS